MIARLACHKMTPPAKINTNAHKLSIERVIRCMRCCIAEVVSNQAKQENHVKDKPTKITAALTLPDTDILAGIRLDNKLTKNTKAFGLSKLVMMPLVKAWRWLFSCATELLATGVLLFRAKTDCKAPTRDRADSCLLLIAAG